jgi:hypothetical protein
VLAAAVLLPPAVLHSSIPPRHAKRAYLGFDRNDYPGDAALPLLRKIFSFAGYWLSSPPGETTSTWAGKREILKKNGFGFAVLFRGREQKDLKSPETGKYVEKYLKAKSDVRTEDRIRILRLIENMVLGAGMVEALHGAGSPQAQRIMILRQADLEEKKKLSKRLAGVKSTPNPDK